MELTNSLRKKIRSLAEAKYRREYGLFVAEGSKCVADTVGAFSCETLLATASWIDANDAIVNAVGRDCLIQAPRAELGRISSLRTPPEVIAVYRIPDAALDTRAAASQLVVALDRVQDPGNLGTIIRACDWFGVTTIIASDDSADLWNPKTVQATMGAIARVRVHYGDLAVMISAIAPAAVYGTFLDGENIYDTALGATGVIVMGNEGRGISDAIASMVDRRLLIPSFPPSRPTSESLNVATATAITLSEFRSRQIKSRN